MMRTRATFPSSIATSTVILLALLATVSVVVWAAQESTAQEPPPMFRLGPDHTGVADGEAPLTGGVLWTIELGSGIISSPVVTGGRVYVGTMGGRVLCLNAYSGSLQWYFDGGMAFESSPAVVDGRVFIGSDDGGVYCLDAEDGSLIWVHMTGGEVKSSPAVVDGRVFVGSNDFAVHCLDAEDGTEIWNYSTGGWVYSSPAVAGGRVYFGSCDGLIYSVKVGNGELDWTFEAEYCPAAPAVWGDLVIIGTYDDHVYYLDRRTGEEVLNVSGDYYDIYASAAVVESGDESSILEYPITFVPDSTGQMIVVGPDGDVENVSFPRGGSSSPLLVRGFPRQYDHLLVYGSDDGSVHAREFRNPYVVRETIHEPPVEWDVKLGASVKSSPFAYHGRIYIGGDVANGRGVVACIGEWDPSTEPFITPLYVVSDDGEMTVIAEVNGSVPVTGFRVVMDGEVHDAEPDGARWRVTFQASPPEGWRNMTMQAFDGAEVIAVERTEVIVRFGGGNQIEVVIDTPSGDEDVKGVFLVTGRASSNSTIDHVHVWWDDDQHGPDFPNGEFSEGNWTAALQTVGLDPGWHTIHVMAYGERGLNWGEASVRVRIAEEPEGPGIGLFDVLAVIALITLFGALLLSKPPRLPEGSSPGRKPPGKV